MLGPLVRSSVLKGCPVDASDQLDVNDRAGTGKHQTIKNPESHISPVGEETPLRQCTGDNTSVSTQVSVFRRFVPEKLSGKCHETFMRPKWDETSQSTQNQGEAALIEAAAPSVAKRDETSKGH